VTKRVVRSSSVHEIVTPQRYTFAVSTLKPVSTAREDHDMKTETITAPAYWAAALVNGDFSGLSNEENAALLKWQVANGNPWVLDVARDEDGEGIGPRFTWSFDLYGGTARGGEVLDYVVAV
jgi:hypothetical protein